MVAAQATEWGHKPACRWHARVTPSRVPMSRLSTLLFGCQRFLRKRILAVGQTSVFCWPGQTWPLCRADCRHDRESWISSTAVDASRFVIGCAFSHLQNLFLWKHYYFISLMQICGRLWNRLLCHALPKIRDWIQGSPSKQWIARDFLVFRLYMRLRLEIGHASFFGKWPMIDEMFRRLCISHQTSHLFKKLFCQVLTISVTSHCYSFCWPLMDGESLWTQEHSPQRD